jgi:AraC family transcriptional regulator
VPGESEFRPLFSTRGTRWAGLVVEKARQLSANRPHIVETAEPRAGYVLCKTELKWAARGTRYKGVLRPGISVFLNEGYRLDELTAKQSFYDAIFVRLEREKIAELMRDDVRSSRVDFLDHVMSNDDQMIGMLNAMFAEAHAGNPAGSLFSESISIALLTHVYDRYDRTGSVRRLEGRLSPRQTEIIGQYIRDHIGCDLSIGELANLLHLSPAYFCKAFSRTQGVTPHRFVLNERIVIAIEKLRQPLAPPLAELASSLGFANQAHFSNVFRKIVGCSPSEFRSRAR